MDADNYHNVSSYGDYVAGLVGYTKEYIELSKDTTLSANNVVIDIVNTGSVAGKGGVSGYVGGLFGYIEKSLGISNVGYTTSSKTLEVNFKNVSSNATYSNGKISTTGSRGYVGAIAGYIGTTFRASTTGVSALTTLNESTVTANSVDIASGYVSGGVGYIANTINLASMTNMAAISSSGNYVGGVIGEADASITLGSILYNGTVKGRDYTAGAIGYNLKHSLFDHL